MKPIHRRSQSQSQRSSLPAADLTAEMETMVKRCGSLDGSFHPSHGMGWPVGIAYDSYDALA